MSPTNPVRFKVIYFLIWLAVFLNGFGEFLLIKLYYPYENYGLNEMVEFSKTVKLAFWLTLGLSIVMPFYWIFFITKKSMRANAEIYARTLLDLSYKV